jgi:hypothetical protein
MHSIREMCGVVDVEHLIALISVRLSFFCRSIDRGKQAFYTHFPAVDASLVVDGL